MVRRIRRFFMPSVTLGGYITRLFLQRFVGILLGLTIILQMLDLLATSDDILAADGATRAELLRYVALRFPQLVSQFAPFAALLATLLSLATLNQHSEIAVMRAAGLSPHRILFPLGLACAMIAGSHFAFHEAVVIDANRSLSGWRSADFAVDHRDFQAAPTAVRITNGSELVYVDTVSLIRGQIVLDGLTLYSRGPRGQITGARRADFAFYSGGQWTLHNVRALDTRSYATEVHARLPWSLTTPPDRFLALSIRPDEESLTALNKAIRQLDREGLPTDRLRSSLMKRLSGPLSSLIMPLLGAVTAFGARRTGSLALRLTIGVALGFTFFVADNFMIAMGKFGVVPPFLAAWAPLLLFVLVGYAILILAEEGRFRRVVSRS